MKAFPAPGLDSAAFESFLEGESIDDFYRVDSSEK
jgi:hypothetical protein